MVELKNWLTEQIEQHLVEPNSGLGEAITYMRKHWEALTLFLRQAGAPLDNNICERALKKAIRHRKNAYFYKTQNGARVGDLFMSLIHTCELNDINTPSIISPNCKSTPLSCPQTPTAGCPGTTGIRSQTPPPPQRLIRLPSPRHDFKFFRLAERTLSSTNP